MSSQMGQGLQLFSVAVVYQTAAVVVHELHLLDANVTATYLSAPAAFPSVLQEEIGPAPACHESVDLGLQYKLQETKGTFLLCITGPEHVVHDAQSRFHIRIPLHYSTQTTVAPEILEQYY